MFLTSIAIILLSLWAVPRVFSGGSNFFSAISGFFFGLFSGLSLSRNTSSSAYLQRGYADSPNYMPHHNSYNYMTRNTHHANNVHSSMTQQQIPHNITRLSMVETNATHYGNNRSRMHGGLNMQNPNHGSGSNTNHLRMH